MRFVRRGRGLNSARIADRRIVLVVEFVYSPAGLLFEYEDPPSPKGYGEARDDEASHS